MTANRRRELLVCAAIFIVLIAWLLIWPFTGEDDSVLHYLNAREAATSPAAALGPWARPLYKLLLVWPATHGIVAARVFQSLLTMILAWQVIRLAEELGIARPWLAGAMLIWQPLVFALGSDTMTELPFALGATIILRLWNKHRFIWACLIAGFLPMIRPEGFLLVGGCLLLLLWAKAPIPKRVIAIACASAGLLVWAIACQMIVGNWRYFIDVWSWPASSYASYGHGTLLHHIVRWPWYCGWVLFPLFCLGIGESLSRREMRVPLLFWTMVLLAHSLLYWRGWFASIGEMRILTTTAPVTALICLIGWNHLPPLKTVRVALAIMASAWVMVEYARHVKHYECFAVHEIAQFVKEHQQVNSLLFTSDKMLLAELGLPNDPSPMSMPREQALERLKSLPVGSIGMWDNRNAPNWFGITIDDLPPLGFDVLYESKRTVRDGPEALFSRGWWIEMRYVVIKKNR